MNPLPLGMQIDEDLGNFVQYGHDPKPLGKIKNSRGEIITNFGVPGDVAAISSDTSYGMGISPMTTVKADALDEITFLPDTSLPFDTISLNYNGNHIGLSSDSEGINSAVLSANRGTFKVSGQNFSCFLSLSGQMIGFGETEICFDLYSDGDIEMINENGILIIKSECEMEIKNQSIYGSKFETISTDNEKKQGIKRITIEKSTDSKSIPKIAFS